MDPDQSDTRPGYGGQLLIYEGADLMSAAAATPMAIVGENDNATVRGNGCSGAQVGEHM